MSQRVLQADDRGRVTLGPKAAPFYLVHEAPDGTLTLTPAEVRPLPGTLAAALEERDASTVVEHAAATRGLTGARPTRRRSAPAGD